MFHKYGKRTRLGGKKILLNQKDLAAILRDCFNYKNSYLSSCIQRALVG